jgi:hypothetical protein
MIRNFIILTFLLIFTGRAFAQQENWGGGVDDDKLHFGFSFQYIAPQFKILKVPQWRSPYFDVETSTYVTDSLNSISSKASQGFGLGFVVDLRLTSNVNLRLTPSLSFTDRLVDYKYANSAMDIQKKVSSTMADLPLGIKLKSDRRRNFRAYVLGGVKYSVDIISKSKKDDTGNIATEKFLKNLNSFITYETGIGFDIYFEPFKMSPEIKLSNSFRNVLKQDNNPYSAPLDKLFLHSLQFSLFFE